ncbi:hypothetical protein Pmani_013118 [Petrolisthes manimaculis]|uniref:PiggyBac transposable element-derived protein domain-containing protein n=1 Tax=Petrolisthes manimaculis TaxID=1843537 RepID=A0AAE1PWM3_9EUCA|nr:hypothetical protein Pmani_013118 [Petrolisthes manimaculis]
MHTPGENLTIDEQLLAFRGRAVFRMYIQKKPAKYGLKLILCCDNKSKYLLGAIPYVANQEPPPQGDLSLGHYYVRQLTRPYHQSNRNVTVDNWFTSIPLAMDLQSNCGLTLVGTIKSNKKEIPSQMRSMEGRIPGSSAFLYDDYMTLVSYAPLTKKGKSSKLVHLLSTMQSTPTLGDHGKPEVVLFYNSTKGGVDAFDQMCATYSCSRKTQRWPLCIFYGMLNAGGINSWIVHSANCTSAGRPPLRRRTFLMELAMELIRPWAQHRLTRPTLSCELVALIRSAFDLPSQPPQAAQAPEREVALLHNSHFNPEKRCRDCPGTAKKSKYVCRGCKVSKYARHLYTYCISCISKGPSCAQCGQPVEKEVVD